MLLTEYTCHNAKCGKDFCGGGITGTGNQLESQWELPHTTSNLPQQVARVVDCQPKKPRTSGKVKSFEGEFGLVYTMAKDLTAQYTSYTVVYTPSKRGTNWGSIVEEMVYILLALYSPAWHCI